MGKFGENDAFVAECSLLAGGLVIQRRCCPH